VSIWRDLKRLGSYYPQHAVCILPGRAQLRTELGKIRERIDIAGGSSTYLEIPRLPDDQDQLLVATFRELADKEYDEIIEECQTRFVKEIEFERYRENFTFEEAEEIRQDFEKICRWFDQVVARDWFDAPGRSTAVASLKEAESMLEAFEADVFERTGGHDHEPT
jgi:hypothetical protein